MSKTILHCSADGCIKKVHGRGLCITHYSRWRLNGDLILRINRGFVGCSIDGCNKPHYCNKLCHNHYKQHYYSDNNISILARRKSDPKIAAQAKAHSALNQKIRSGKWRRFPCEKCGHWKTEAHHDDYSMPLEVRFLCHTHHMEWHKINTPDYGLS